VELLNQVRARNLTKSAPYSDIISQYSKLLGENQKLKDRTSNLERENRLLKSSDGSSEKTILLQEEIHRLQSELNDALKHRTSNASESLELRTELDKKKDSLHDIEKELDALKFVTDDQTTLLREKDEIINKFSVDLKQHKDMTEHLQSEIDNANKVLREKINENQGLVNQLLTAKLEYSKIINEMNDSIAANQQIHTSQQNLASHMPTCDLSDIPTSSVFQPELVQVKLPKKARRKEMGHREDINAVSYSYDGDVVASASSDSSIIIWDSTDLTKRSTLTGMDQPVVSLAFNAQGDFLAAGGAKRLVKLWDLKTGRIRHTFGSHSQKASGVKFFYNTPGLVTCSLDHTIKQWDVLNGKNVKTLQSISAVTTMEMTYEDAMVISGHSDGHVRIWSLSGAELLNDLDYLHHEQTQVTAVVLSNDANKLMTYGRDNSITIVDLRTYQVLHKLTHSDLSNGFAHNKPCWSADDRFVVAGSKNGSIYIWNATTGKLKDIYSDTHKQGVHSVAWKPRAPQFCSVDALGGIILWE